MDEKQRERLWDAIGYVSAATLVGVVGWLTFFYNPKDDQERIPKRQLPQVYAQQIKPATYVQPSPSRVPSSNLAIIVGDQADGSDVLGSVDIR